MLNFKRINKPKLLKLNIKRLNQEKKMKKRNQIVFINFKRKILYPTSFPTLILSFKTISI